MANALLNSTLWAIIGNEGTTIMAVDDRTKNELEAAAFRRLVKHLR